MDTVLLYPNVKCPVGCLYCFEDENSVAVPDYDKQKMIETLKTLVDSPQRPSSVILHGGDVLALPIEDLEFFVQEAVALKLHPELQTSLFHLTDEHIQLFKKHNMNPGVSIDGPPELNILRGPRDKKANALFQKRVVKNLEKLEKAGIAPGTITILSGVNASEQSIDKLIAWGIKHKIKGRFNPMFTPWWTENHPAKQYELSAKELTYAFLKLAEAHWAHPKDFRPSIVDEMIGNLRGQRLGCCIFTRCDYIHTQCQTILGDGGIARCDRCFQDGYYYSAPTKTTIRSDMLKQTDCRGCRYFEICGGGCPGEGLDNDFRRKTKFCEAYKTLYEVVETRLRSVHPDITLATDVSNYYNDYWLKGIPLRRDGEPCKPCHEKQQQPPQKDGYYHQDYSDTAGKVPPMIFVPAEQNQPTPDRNHEDWGGEHQDHTDEANPRHEDSGG